MKKNKVFSIVTICVYLLALIINFTVAIKYPDLSISTPSFLISLILLLLLLFYSFFGGKIYRIMMIIGVVGSVFISVVQYYQDVIYDIWILDVLSALQYPLYVMYVAPLFGINFLLDYTPAMYSLSVSIVFLICFIISVYIRKNNNITSSVPKKA